MKPELHYDLLISGAGAPGLALALQAARAGLKVALVDRGRDPRQAGQGSDLRSAALLAGPKRYLQSLDAWPDADATPLRRLTLLDSGRLTATPSRQLDFDAAAHGLDALAWNVPNQALRAMLARQAAAEPSLTLAFGQQIVALDLSGAHPRIQMSASQSAHSAQSEAASVSQTERQSVTATMLVAADGAKSPVRASAQISLSPLSRRRATQRALTGRVTHSRSLDETSYEFQRPGGPLTLVPCSLSAAQPARTAFVWSEDHAQAERLRSLTDADFLLRFERASEGLLGDIHALAGRGAFPIRPQLAASLYRGAVAVMAEAAHVYPPSGAQGMNTSLADAAMLGDLLAARGLEDVPRLLRQYQASRLPDHLARYAATGGLSAMTRLSDPLGQAFRRFGFRWLASGQVRQTALVRFGATPFGPAPRSFG